MRSQLSERGENGTEIIMSQIIIDHMSKNGLELDNDLVEILIDLISEIILEKPEMSEQSNRV
jgi:hypothetical protein